MRECNRDSVTSQEGTNKVSSIYLTDEQRASIEESKRQDRELHDKNVRGNFERWGTRVEFSQAVHADGTPVSLQLFVLLFNHPLSIGWHRQAGQEDRGYHIGYIDPTGTSFRWLAGLRSTVEMPAGRLKPGPISDAEARLIEEMALATRDELLEQGTDDEQDEQTSGDAVVAGTIGVGETETTTTDG